MGQTRSTIDQRKPLNMRHPLYRGLMAMWRPMPKRAGGGELVHDLSPRRKRANLTWTTGGDPVVGKLIGAAGPNPWGAWSFDGTDDYLHVGQQDKLDWGAVSGALDAWIRTTADYSGGFGVVAINGAGGAGQKRYLLHINTSNQIRFDIDDDTSGLKTVNDSVAINDGLWHHVLGTREAAIGGLQEYIRLFVDGHEVANLNIGSTYGNLNDTEGFTIGGSNTSGTPGANQFFSGQIAQVRVWNRHVMGGEPAALRKLDLADESPLFNWVEAPMFVPPSTGIVRHVIQAYHRINA